MTDTFNIEKFNPTVAELQNLADSYRGLTIASIDDVKGRDLVLEAKRDLQSKRVYISKAMKSYRDDAIKFQKDVIAKEKQLISIISEVENEMDSELQKIEDEKERLKRIETLPIRWEELKKLGLETEYTEDFLLTMNYKDFCDFIITEKSRIFDERQAKEELEAREKKRLLDIENAKQEAIKQTEERIKKEQEAKEIQEIALKKQTEERIKKEQEAKEIQEIALKKQQAYIDFRQENGWTKETSSEFYEYNNGESIILYKKIAEFKL